MKAGSLTQSAPLHIQIPPGLDCSTEKQQIHILNETLERGDKDAAVSVLIL